jgi:hypothetical protein
MKNLATLTLGLVISATSSWVSADTQSAAPSVYQEAYALYLLQHPDNKSQNSQALIQTIQQDYQALFASSNKVNQTQFVQYEQQKLSELMKQRREMSLKQAHVRFGILDADKNQKMSLKEFQDIGIKNFAEYDKNTDGLVSAEDIALAAGEGTQTHDGFRVRLPISMPMANNPNEFIGKYGQNKSYATLADFLSERDKQFFATDRNQDLVVSEQEYVDEFMQRYDLNATKGTAKMQALSARKFQAIAGNKSTIQAKDIAKFAKKLDQAISQ